MTGRAVALAAVGMLFVPLTGSAQDEIAGLPAATLAQSIPFFAFAAQGGNPALILTKSGGATEFDPRVLVASRNGWRLLTLGNDVHNTTWVSAGRVIDGGELWGITAGQVEGRNVLYFLSAGRDGRVWRFRGFLPTVSRFAVVESFAMNKSDKGTLVLRLDDDPSPEAPRLGYYIYLTKNGGREWSAPIYSQGRPLPPSDPLLLPERSFTESQPPDLATWRVILENLQPPG
jgi:hypothetical protein